VTGMQEQDADLLSPIRNLLKPEEEIKEQKLKVEESKAAADAEMHSEHVLDNYNVDMNCNENLLMSEGSDPVTVRSVLSPIRTSNCKATAEKEFHPDKVSNFMNNTHEASSCQRTQDQTNRALAEQTQRKSHLSTIRKNCDSLKRNLFAEFKNIHSQDEKDKKETIDEHYSSPEEMNEDKSPRMSELPKQSLLE